MRIASRGMSGQSLLNQGRGLQFNLQELHQPMKLSLLLKLNVPLRVAGGLVLAAALLTTHVVAQENPTGSITGKVSSVAGAPIAKAKITIINKTTGQTSNAQTGATGTFTAPDLAVTEYELRVDAKDFISTTESVTVQADKAASVDFVLDPEPVPGVLPAQDLRGLPIDNRNVLSVAQLAPGVQFQDGGTIDPTKNGFPSLSFDSRYSRAARINVDGLDINDETVGTITQNLPASAVQEFRLGGLLAPITDRIASAGVPNVVTRSGTDE